MYKTLLFALCIILSVWGIAEAASPVNLLPSSASRITGGTITFSWKPVAGATLYGIRIGRGTNYKFSGSFTPEQAGCTGSTGTCSVSLGLGLDPGRWTWSTRAQTPSGTSDWSNPTPFTTSDELRTPIYSVPFTIVKPGSYFLAENLTSASHGIIIESDDVVIDLNGYTLTGPGTTTFKSGIDIEAPDIINVEVRNGTIKSFSSGVLAYNGSDRHAKAVKLVGVKASGCGNGISLYGSGHTVRECTTINNNGAGIFVGEGTLIENSTAAENKQTGISCSKGCVVSGNVAYKNGSHGIWTNYASTIRGNTSYSNTRYGIVGNTNALVEGNSAYDNNAANGKVNYYVGGVAANNAGMP